VVGEPLLQNLSAIHLERGAQKVVYLETLTVNIVC